MPTGAKDVLGSFWASHGSGDRDMGTPPTTVVTRGVVEEVLADPGCYSDQEFAELTLLLSSPPTAEDADDPEEQVKKGKVTLAMAPRNSILANVVSYGEGKRTLTCKLCFPFFPPHLCFPVKPGEQVWIIDECPDAGSTISYWMCRIPEPNFVDDINYTHGDRKFTVNAPGSGALDTKKRCRNRIRREAEYLWVPKWGYLKRTRLSHVFRVIKV